MHSLPIQQFKQEKTTYTNDYKNCLVVICNILGVRATAAIATASASSICRWRKRTTTANNQRIRSSMITDVMVDAIKYFVLQSTNIRALDVKAFVQQHFNINISRQTVQVIISKRIGLSFKRTRKRGRKRGDDDEYLARRDNYIRRLKEHTDLGQVLVSIDESGFDERVRPVYGYAMKGQQAIAYHPPVSVSKHKRILRYYDFTRLRFYKKYWFKKCLMFYKSLESLEIHIFLQMSSFTILRFYEITIL
jgi:transposase